MNSLGFWCEKLFPVFLALSVWKIICEISIPSYSLFFEAMERPNTGQAAASELVRAQRGTNLPKKTILGFKKQHRVQQRWWKSSALINSNLSPGVWHLHPGWEQEAANTSAHTAQLYFIFFLFNSTAFYCKKTHHKCRDRLCAGGEKKKE